MRCAAPALLLLLVGWGAILWLPPFSSDGVNDLFVFRGFADAVLDGEIPYRDAFLEYPPLAAPAIALPGVLGGGEEGFRLAYAGWTLLLAAAVVVLCGALAVRTGGSRQRALLAAAAMPFLCGALLRTHFDLAPVALTLLALLLVVADRPRLGMGVLGLAVMTKGFPIVVAPVALAWLAAGADRRVALQAAAALVATAAAVGTVALVASPDGAWGALTYQVDRPVQVESAPAAFLYALDGIGLGEADSIESHRSDGLEHPLAGTLAALLAATMFGVLALLSIQAALRPDDPRALVLASLAAILAFAALGRILSPQFVIWAIPLGALALAWRYHALALAVALAAALTQVEFPAHYFDVVDREPLALAVVCLRDATLIAALALAVRALDVGGEQELLHGGGATVGAGLH